MSAAQLHTSTSASDHPPHLEPSELGTKEYWESYYERSLEHLSTSSKKQQPRRRQQPDDERIDEQEEVSDDDEDDDDGDPGTSWFTEHNAPEKVVRFLMDEDFPLAPCNLKTSGQSHTGADSNNNDAESLWILDLGTGNGSMLTMLRDAYSEAGCFDGADDVKMVGVDYSEKSVELARRLAGAKETNDSASEIRFEIWDVLAAGEKGYGTDMGAVLKELEWFPAERNGFDIVLDKGTFDAVSLCGEEVRTSPGNFNGNGKGTRACEVYPRIAARLVRKGGFLVVTSCNWTEEELIRWFTTAGGDHNSNDGLEVWGRIEYPKFRFGGMEGQGVCTVCFRRRGGRD